MSWSFEPPPVEDLWDYWIPRFIAAGVDPAVITQLREEIGHWDEWHPAWTRFADETEGWAERALQEGNTLTAGELLVRAAILHHFAGMVLVDDMDKFTEAEDRRVAAFRRGGALLDPPTIPIAVPFQGIEMPGYLRVPKDADGPVPVVVFVNGWEGVKESTTSTEALLARGIATFTMDGPGIGETLRRLPMTGDYGPPIAAAFDVLEARDDIDGSRLAIHGGSRGGLIGARAAAYDKRTAALAVVGPGYETRRLTWSPGMQGLVDAFMQHLFHTDSVEAANERANQPDFSLQGIGEQITCPSLVVTDNDAAERAEGTLRFYEELADPKTLLVVPGAQRNGHRRAYIVQPYIADWFAKQLL